MSHTLRTRTIPSFDGAKLLIVEARFHESVADMLVEGAMGVLEAAKARVERIAVPGALEVPTAIALHLGHYEAFVALGCVIRGETTHYELVSGESCHGIVELGLRERALIGNGILTVETMEQALVRADPQRQDKGGDAAYAALTLLGLKRRLGAARA